ncbi:MAG: hypothetical protein ABIP12_01025, partial [Terriglobales bacterium]
LEAAVQCFCISIAISRRDMSMCLFPSGEELLVELELGREPFPDGEGCWQPDINRRVNKIVNATRAILFTLKPK